MNKTLKYCCILAVITIFAIPIIDHFTQQPTEPVQQYVITNNRYDANGQIEKLNTLSNTVLETAYAQEIRTAKPTATPKVKPTAKAKVKKQTINENDLYALSHLIYAEAGSELCSDEARYYVGSVVLNRVKSKYFKPNTIEGIIFQKGQYECTWIGTYYNEPTDICVKISKDLLQNGSKLPDNVVFQAEFKQGDGVYKYIDDMYFCYKN